MLLLSLNVVPLFYNGMLHLIEAAALLMVEPAQLKKVPPLLLIVGVHLMIVMPLLTVGLARFIEGLPCSKSA